VYAERSLASEEMIAKTLQGSMEAQRSWKQVPVAERAAICRRMADWCVAKADALAEELTWHVLSRYDVVVGGRVTRSTAGGETILGATLGAGMWFDRTLRLLLGVNYARHDWAFEADDSIPGVFLSLTGVYGAAGAPASFGH